MMWGDKIKMAKAFSMNRPKEVNDVAIVLAGGVAIDIELQHLEQGENLADNLQLTASTEQPLLDNPGQD